MDNRSSRVHQQLNNKERSVTGCSPRYLLLDKINTDWINDRELALKNTTMSDKYNKTLYEKTHEDYNFNVEDMVYVENGNKLQEDLR